jgi:hypothetical protein
MVAVFLISIPALRPVAAVAGLGGVVLAPILHRLYR